MDSEPLTDKLSKQFRQIERLRILGQLAASVAHDLKNVVGIVAFTAETLSDKINLPEEAREYVDVIHRNSEEALRIVRELLDFTKTRETALVPGSVNDVLESSLKLVKAKCVKHKITLESRLSPRLPPVMAAPFELKSAFLNLFLNAVEAMPDGGRLRVESQADESAKRVEVFITDTGVGLSDDDLKNIGQPFFTTKPEGSGLGFYITKQILDQHKAVISFGKNTNGTGVTVRISFPQIP